MAKRAAASVDDVFINCPFDPDFTEVFRALVFCIYACQFRPRSAFELDDCGQLRLEKLYGLIEQCRYGIHDLSRTELDAANKLPRFNMPLELGLFLGAKRYGNAGQRLKRALILDIERRRYQKFISDLAGMDIKGTRLGRVEGTPANARLAGQCLAPRTAERQSDCRLVRAIPGGPHQDLR